MKKWSNGTLWSSISPVEATLYMGMRNMVYVYQVSTVLSDYNSDEVQ